MYSILEKLVDRFQKIGHAVLMETLLQQMPDEISQLAERCRAHINKRFSLDLDFTGDTLSVLDFFIEEMLKDENGGESPPGGHRTRLNMVHLFAPTFGAYFGAMLINQFGGRFRYTEKEVQEWRFEFDTFFVRFNPVAVAANVIAKQEVEGMTSILQSSPKLLPKLQERFDAAPDVSEQDFFSFCTFYESIQIAHEFLNEVAKKDGKVDCSVEGYDSQLGHK